MGEKLGGELIVFQKNYVCDECKIGLMVATGHMSNKGNGGFEHKCNNVLCGITIGLQYHYPTTAYKLKEDEIIVRI